MNILNMLHILRFLFSSRCRLFYNAIFSGSCNIHILNTECAKILNTGSAKNFKENYGAKWLVTMCKVNYHSAYLHITYAEGLLCGNKTSGIEA